MTTANNCCFGNYGAEKACANCRYRASCKYYTTHPIDNRRPRQECIDYDAVSAWALQTADFSDIPGCESEDTDLIGVDKLAAFFRYLLNLDKYTLEILKMFFDDRPGKENIPSVSEIAAVRGCSRQAVHRKILDIIKRNPELSRLFSLTLRHLPRDRRRYAGA